MKPSCWRIFARASFCFEEGIFTTSWYCTLPLRMRVSMSAMGSVIVMWSPPLQRALRHARDLARQCELAEADPAQAELAVHGARAAAALAAGVAPHLELGRPVRLLDE